MAAWAAGGQAARTGGVGWGAGTEDARPVGAGSAGAGGSQGGAAVGGADGIGVATPSRAQPGP